MKEEIKNQYIKAIVETFSRNQHLLNTKIPNWAKFIYFSHCPYNEIDYFAFSIKSDAFIDSIENYSKAYPLNGIFPEILLDKTVPIDIFEEAINIVKEENYNLHNFFTSQSTGKEKESSSNPNFSLSQWQRDIEYNIHGLKMQAAALSETLEEIRGVVNNLKKTVNYLESKNTLLK